MLSTLLALALCVFTQAPAADDAARVIAPFVDPDALAVVQLDLDRTDFEALAARVGGDEATTFVAERVKPVAGLAAQLRAAGVHRLFVVVNPGDLPGPPVVVAPQVPAAHADAIAGLLCGKGANASPLKLPACATIKGAVVAGSERALDRVRKLEPTPRPELAAAFASVADEPTGLRIVLIPSPDTRRVFEELVPTLPQQLGGGPITSLTHGVLWMAAGVGLDGANPSFRLVIASPDAASARALEKTGRSVVDLIGKGPFDPQIPRRIAQLTTEVQGDRIRVSGDAATAAGLIDAVVRPARMVAIRTVSINNEKQIALALHNYASAHKSTFPPGYLTGKDGKPLLSWRVMILPYIEQEALFKEFHLDEPWDSPHNKALIARMPETLRSPLQSSRSAREGKTRYVGLRGEGTIFRGAQPVGLRDITDGTSNTIFFLEVGDDRAVTWTRPDDLEVPADEAALRAVLATYSTPSGRGTEIAFADGSVHFLREGLKLTTFRALATFASGESISANEL